MKIWIVIHGYEKGIEIPSMHSHTNYLYYFMLSGFAFVLFSFRCVFLNKLRLTV